MSIDLNSDFFIICCLRTSVSHFILHPNTYFTTCKFYVVSTGYSHPDKI